GVHTLISYSDGGRPGGCPDVYRYPDPGAQTSDESCRIAAPGRVPADVVRINAADEPWMDMIGNLQEASIRAADDPAVRFRYKGWGQEYTSVGYHRSQMSSSRGKSGAIGARCMRFK